MLLLLSGLVVFLGVHTFSTLRQPQGGPRAALILRLGDGPYKGLYSLVSAVGLVLIVWGFVRYRTIGYVPIWNPPSLLHPVALVLMWISFVALAATYSPLGKIKSTLRHPMLVSVKTWALAHLMVNGDAGSLLLFAAFLAWAVWDRIALKRRGDKGAPAVAGPTAGDAIALVAGTIAYVAMWWLHPIVIGVPVNWPA